ncbi:trimethylamine methyltransferase family protein [Aliamphritea ceti]|uniref:trimethylamine methyltransferase family protein n=1 Tax=Aliamphritea ceti TaxID=1524258 RepID=UPI0021C306CF|nr:trimethylamine methyltransferase family protein [Aliamphritea ceti]
MSQSEMSSTGAVPASERGRRNRRQGSIKQRNRALQNNGPKKARAIEREVPIYNLLDDAALDALEAQADWILETIGIVFKDDAEALALFAAAGAVVDGERVKFPQGLARELCKTAPQQFQMYGREPGYEISIGGNSVVLTPAYGSPFVTDLDNGRRYATLHDFENFIKLSHVSPWMHHSGGTVCEPVNIPVNKRHLDMVYAHLRYSSKPFMGSVTNAERAEDSIAMARLVYGHEYMENHCVIQGNINVNSPLVFDDVMTGALKAYARANQGIVLSPFILGGAMGPVTQPALIAQAHAEAMVGIALGQLVRPGSPVVYGNFLTTMNLKTGAPTFGTPEANLSAMAIGQLCRRLGLPLRCGGHLTASKVADGQAMQESSDSMNAGLLAGGNYILHAAGWLEGGLTIGYEKFVMDLDRCGMIHTQLAGLTIDANSLGTQAYLQAGPGENFLATDHTMANFRDANYLSDLADTNSFEQWTEDGSLTIEQRANARWKAMLAEYRLPEFDPAIDRELKAFIEERKASMPDMWY